MVVRFTGSTTLNLNGTCGLKSTIRGIVVWVVQLADKGVYSVTRIVVSCKHFDLVVSSRVASLSGSERSMLSTTFPHLAEFRV